MSNTVRKIIFATHNLHKLNEVKKILGDRFNLLSLRDVMFYDNIPEDFDTLEENASQKAWHIYNKFKIDCFADDTGLEVEALNGQPGVFSARYAGPQNNPIDNMNKLLANLQFKDSRNAQFRTVISLILKGEELYFEGVVKGTIINNPRGERGFGYDPIFQPLGYTLTFSEMDLDLKNSISHRGIALKKLSNFLISI